MPDRKWLAGVLAAVALAAAGLWIWQSLSPSDERDITRRLRALGEEFNLSTTDGLGTAARAARFGTYFTDDVVVELGGGSPAINGRDTLMGMAARLQPRTAAFVIDFRDVTVTVLEPRRAEASLTAVIRRRVIGTDEESLDAREFALALQKMDDVWRISHASAVETLKK
jgi:hypothetical protein